MDLAKYQKDMHIFREMLEGYEHIWLNAERLCTYLAQCWKGMHISGSMLEGYAHILLNAGRVCTYLAK